MVKQTKKQTGTKPQSEGETTESREGERPEEENLIEASENEAPQESDTTPGAEGKTSESSEGEKSEEESSETGEDEPDDKENLQNSSFDFNYKIALVEKACDAVPQGEFLMKKFKKGQFVQGAHAQNMVSFGWAHWATAEELAAIKDNIKNDDGNADA